MKRDEVSSAETTTGTEATDSPETVENPGAGEPSAAPRRASGPVAAASCPRMRSDLRFVHEDTGDEDGERLPGLLRIIDLRNDRKFDFSAQEHFLCKQADGEQSTDDLQQRLAAITDQPLSTAQVAKFFRRLNILGLLEPEEVAPAPVAGAGARLRGRPARAPTGPAGPTPHRAAATDQPGSKLTLVRPEPAELTAAPHAAAPGADAAAPSKPAAPEPVSSEPVSSEPAASEPALPAVTPPVRRFAAGKPAFKPGPQIDDEDDDGFVDLFGVGGDSDGRFGGRMRPGLGGMGGGGMGGGGMGGMGGGGMGGMGGGGMGGMGGGMMGMRGRQMQEPAEREPGPTEFFLFNPDLLFRVLYFTFWPLKFLLWTMVPLTVFSGLTMIRNMPALGADIVAVLAGAGLVEKLLVGVLIDNLGSRIVQGVAITAHGGRVKRLGINLMLGFLPRFYIDESVIEKLDRRGQIWAFGAPLLFRLSLFVFGILIWAITRESGGLIPFLALTVAKFGLIMFTITAWPLIPHDGMKFVGAILGQPKLLTKAVMAARSVFLNGKRPMMIRPEEIWPLALYALATFLTTVLILGVGFILVLSSLQRSLDGLGVAIFLGLMVVATFWIIAASRVNKRNMAVKKRETIAGLVAKRGGPKAAMAAGMTGGMMGGGAARAFRDPQQPVFGDDSGPVREKTVTDASTAKAKTDVERLPNRARVVWSLILCSLLVAGFLPYSYEAGGEVEILPAARGTAVARTDGEIVEVLVAQGDSVVSGTPLARLSDWDQLSNVSVREAQLAGATATLARLEAGAQPEEIDVARAKLARSEATAAYKKAEVERARSLVASETVSPAAVEKAEAEYATATADVQADKAGLALALAGATKEELEFARADVNRLERELSYDRDELQRTVIVAPMDGTVVTADLPLRVGHYLKTGEELLKIEKTDVVTATISVPEADVGFIKPGQRVRLRAQSQSDIEVTGRILHVAPVAEDAGYGRIVRATAEFPNADGILRSSMTGWAKIEGGEMLAWQAYLRTIVRFVKIDIWSWIP